jgi:WD40 repeat protein
MFYDLLRRRFVRVFVIFLIVLSLLLGMRLIRPNLIQTWSDERADALAISPDGQLLAVRGGPLEQLHLDAREVQMVVSRLELRRTVDGQLHNSFRAVLVRAAAFSPDGRLVAASGGDGLVRIWQMSDGTLLHSLAYPSFDPVADSIIAMHRVIFSSDGELLATSSGANVLVWRVSDGALVHQLTGASSPRSIAFSPDGQFLAAESNSRGAMLWRVSDGQHLKTFPMSNPDSVAFSPDGQWLAVAGASDRAINNYGEIRLWRVQGSAAQPERILDVPAFIDHVAFSPDGRVLAAVNGASHSNDSPLGSWRLWPYRCRIYFFRMPDGEHLATFKSPQERIWDITFSPNGQRLLTSGSDTVRIWRVPHGGLPWHWIVVGSVVILLLGLGLGRRYAQRRLAK